jgi:hypothetical protein
VLSFLNLVVLIVISECTFFPEGIAVCSVLVNPKGLAKITLIKKAMGQDQVTFCMG